MTSDGPRGRVRLDGFHALKHALRFGAPGLHACTDRFDATLALARDLAPDCVAWLVTNLQTIDSAALKTLTDELHPTRIVATCDRPSPSPFDASSLSTPLVVLEDPRHHGNLGASIRVAAGLGASGLAIIGEADPWSPSAIRGAAGLQFALPMYQWATIAQIPYAPLVAVDPDGTSILDATIAPNSLLCFGTEREGLSEELLDRCSARIRLPMREGVSSLNLATSVSATLLALGVGPLRAEFARVLR